MRKMKDSGIEWIGDIPEGWGIKKFKIIFSFGRGLAITKENLVSCGIPVINYGQIHAKENIGTTLKECLLRFVPEYFLDESKDSLLCYGDIVFADTSEDYAGVGNNVFIDVRFKIFSGYHTIICRPKISDCTKYIAYLLQTDFWRNQVRKNVSGIKVFSITQKSLRDTFILLPPLSEQQRIADYLDAKCARIDATVELVRQSMEKLRAYKLSLITEAVTKGLDPDVPMKDSGIPWIGKIPDGWEVKRLRYLGMFQNGISKAGEFFGHGFPFVSYKDVYLNISLPQELLSLIDSTDSERQIYSVKSGDVFFTRTSETIDEIGFASTCMATVKDACFAGFLIRFRPYNGVLYNSFSKYYFRSSIHRAYFAQMNIVTRASLSQDVLEQFNFEM